MLVSGPSKSRKTFSALDVGIAIASGEKWLGRKTTKANVLYLNLELRAFGSTERVTKICSARGQPVPNGLKIWNLRGETVTLEALTIQLPILLAEFNCTVVCIDPHYKVSSVSGMEENSNDSQGRLLTLMEGVCFKAGAALIITHHFAKGNAAEKNAIDRASGGGVFARWGDVMMTFTPHERDDCMVVEMALRDFAPVEPFVVRWIYPRWIREERYDPANLKRAGRPEKHSAAFALQVLADQLLTNTEWLKAAKMPESTFREKRDELLASGKVVCSANCYRATG
jgi:hypothetical protein